MKLRTTTPEKKISQHYFPYPQVIRVNGNKDKDPVLSPVNDIADGVVSNIRTESCQPPKKGSHYASRWPENVKYGCGQHPTARETIDYIGRNEVQGFGKWAIVARRWSHPMRFVHGHQWGMIVDVHNVPVVGLVQPWFPYTVRWLTSGNEELAWAEDLVVIHQALDGDMLLDIIEQQGVDVDDARESVERNNRRLSAY